MRANQYIIKSLELHLFFGRIMKEHAFFLQAGFTPAAPAFSQKAEFFRKEFEALLSEAIALSSGVVSKEVLSSGETVTEFTEQAERQTEFLTGIPIDKNLTCQILQLKCAEHPCGNCAQLCPKVRRLNRTALNLLEGLIAFKENLLQRVLAGELFTVNYPLLIEHILREAKLYRNYIQILERESDLSDRIVKENECFWNQIMMEHAQFIRGLLDPCETELLCAADGFASEFCKLLESCRCAHDRTLTSRTLEQTIKLRDFKAAGTLGIQNHRIRSIILPLLADHVLREANHYIRLLQC